MICQLRRVAHPLGIEAPLSAAVLRMLDQERLSIARRSHVWITFEGGAAEQAPALAIQKSTAGRFQDLPWFPKVCQRSSNVSQRSSEVCQASFQGCARIAFALHFPLPGTSRAGPWPLAKRSPNPCQGSPRVFQGLPKVSAISGALEPRAIPTLQVLAAEPACFGDRGAGSAMSTIGPSVWTRMGAGMKADYDPMSGTPNNNVGVHDDFEPNPYNDVRHSEPRNSEPDLAQSTILEAIGIIMGLLNYLLRGGHLANTAPVLPQPSPRHGAPPGGRRPARSLPPPSCRSHPRGTELPPAGGGPHGASLPRPAAAPVVVVVAGDPGDVRVSWVKGHALPRHISCGMTTEEDVWGN
eukprot:gene13556-biopygen8659